MKASATSTWYSHYLNNIKPAFLLTAIFALLAVACTNNQNELTYRLEGTAEGFGDGDMLLLSNVEGETLDSIVIKDEEFTYSGRADSVGLYVLNVQKDEFNSLTFISEPGTIKVKISAVPGGSSIAGTVANDALQELNAETEPYYQKIQEIESTIYADTVLNRDAEWALAERYNQLMNEISRIVKASAQKNIDNELGFILLTSYPDLQEDVELAKSLIAQMPEAYKLRTKTAQLEARLKTKESGSVGQRIADLTMISPDEEEVSLMGEVGKNKLTIIDLWASWSGAWRDELPFMKKVYAEFHEKGLGIVGISIDNSKEEWLKAIHSLKLEWPQMSDLKGWESAATQYLQVNSLPYPIVVDSEGRILLKGLRGEALKTFISEQMP